ncbi:hypothetical protein GRW89_16615 [Pseudomonas moraviensis]|jgi:hypothetical protein|uniref:hypothetical protein n=1 Tax=Pseudomonas TaxID=286 RepID=UPI00135EB9F5|nr:MULTISPECIES: hypothetical protein [Pseudomonas]MXI48123.1 hypothetical protein [Pseudomonas moraviensis]UVK95535.1 hypothetical protein LOY49_09420 [Pseudomonas atacamensis]UVL16177.1 hypothetical protein LOY27_10090 [Pseudomonas atacamensis]
MALKRHIRDQVSKTLTLARAMIPAWSKLTLSQSKVPTNDQRTGIRHPAILVQIKMPRRAEITAAQNRRIELFRVRDPAIAPGFLLPPNPFINVAEMYMETVIRV